MMKSANYLAINPMGKVPASKHSDQVVTECAAICADLADAFPDANLAPDRAQRANYYRWLFFAAGPLESALTNKNLGVEATDETQRMAGYGTFDLVTGLLDAMLGRRDYVCGDTFSAADVYQASHVGSGLMFKRLEQTDIFLPCAERMHSRPA